MKNDKEPTRAKDVSSPRVYWSLVSVIYDGYTDGKKETSAVAVGIWKGKPTLAIRTNGTLEDPIGSPQSRGLGTWQILGEEFWVGILTSPVISDKKVALARQILWPES